MGIRYALAGPAQWPSKVRRDIAASCILFIYIHYILILFLYILNVCIMHTFLLHVNVRLKMGEMTNTYDPKDMGSINASK